MPSFCIIWSDGGRCVALFQKLPCHQGLFLYPVGGVVYGKHFASITINDRIEELHFCSRQLNFGMKQLRRDSHVFLMPSHHPFVETCAIGEQGS